MDRQAKRMASCSVVAWRRGGTKPLRRFLFAACMVFVAGLLLAAHPQPEDFSGEPLSKPFVMSEYVTEHNSSGTGQGVYFKIQIQTEVEGQAPEVNRFYNSQMYDWGWKDAHFFCRYAKGQRGFRCIQKNFRIDHGTEGW